MFEGSYRRQIHLDRFENGEEIKVDRRSQTLELPSRGKNECDTRRLLDTGFETSREQHCETASHRVNRIVGIVRVSIVLLDKDFVLSYDWLRSFRYTARTIHSFD